MQSENQKKLVVITGCDTGIGKSLVQLFSEKGFSVAASYLTAPPSEAVFHKKMDLRLEKDISGFAEYIRSLSAEGYILHALIHNAGMVSSAPIENIPMEALREVFEVNFFGIYSLTQKLLPLIIPQKSAIFLIGSLAGKVGLPFFSPYVSSKFAVEGLTESLRREMLPFGVRTVLFEPGAVATPIWNNSWARIKNQFLPLVDSKYKKVFESAAGQFVSGGNSGIAVDKAAQFVYKILRKKKPRARYIISKKPLVDYLETLVPTGLMDKIISGLFKMDQIGK